MKANTVRAAIENKTDHQSRSRKHITYAIDRHGREVIPLVTVPHGRDDLKIGTQNSIRNALRLNKEQFQKFVNCPLSKRDYEEILDNLIADGEL